MKDLLAEMRRDLIAAIRGSHKYVDCRVDVLACLFSLADAIPGEVLGNAVRDLDATQRKLADLLAVCRKLRSEFRCDRTWTSGECAMANKLDEIDGRKP